MKVTRHHPRLASGCWPALPDGIGYPESSNDTFHIAASPFPSSLRKDTLVFLKVAAFAAWFSLDNDFAATQQLPVACAKDNGVASTAERTAPLTVFFRPLIRRKPQRCWNLVAWRRSSVPAVGERTVLAVGQVADGTRSG